MSIGEYDIVKVKTKQPRKKKEVEPEVALAKSLEPDIKIVKPPTEKQLAARARQKEARELKKKAEQDEKLKELYAIAEAQKALEEKERLSDEKKAAAALKRKEVREAKKLLVDEPAMKKKKIDVVKSTSTVNETDALEQPMPKARKGKSTPFGYDATGIAPSYKDIETVDIERPPRKQKAYSGRSMVSDIGRRMR